MTNFTRRRFLELSAASASTVALTPGVLSAEEELEHMPWSFAPESLGRTIPPLTRPFPVPRSVSTYPSALKFLTDLISFAQLTTV